MAQMIIANRLTDGRTVFLKEAGGWVDAIDDARLIDEATAGEWLAAAKRDEAANLVVEPYLIDVGDDRQPLVWREQIRAGGPTVLVGAGGAAVVRARARSRSGSAGRAGKLRRAK
ncbi:MAG: DUF2849 domain-containing protein [Chromatiales bacterium]|nr:DUF2849 domain-containing protein [Chromatiales bacterium]